MVQRIKCWLVQAQASGQALTEEEIHFWQIQDFLTFKLFRQSSHPYAAYQADDLDAYDSDYNLNYDLFNQSEQIMTSSEQSNDVSQTETDITSDSNIIPYSQYLSETQQNCPDLNSSAQQDFLILGIMVCLAALKNELRKLKGKALDNEDTVTHSVDPKVSKDNMEPITPKLLNKRTAHSSYITSQKPTKKKKEELEVAEEEEKR
ncbi:hypothetical protein Tco_0768976 [Tanacetum coccineum]|uniref:Uncharacterized protein n=1 Tax=Tanacetum coccineum TaxID=301880 RepID=A0ABQ4Z8A2_9ASTR